MDENRNTALEHMDRISGNIGGVLNLAVGRSSLEPPNYRKFRLHLAPGDLWSARLQGPTPNLNRATTFECPVWSQSLFLLISTMNFSIC